MDHSTLKLACGISTMASIYAVPYVIFIHYRSGYRSGYGNIILHGLMLSYFALNDNNIMDMSSPFISVSIACC